MSFSQPMLDRRRFLALTAAVATAPHLKTFAETPAASLVLYPDRRGIAVPANFVGLSYETQQLSDPTFFTGTNAGLIQQFRALSPNGVLRLGGNTSDYGFWKPTPTSVAPARVKRPYKIGDPPPDLSYAVTPQAVENLRDFLNATGWTCIYGINFGTNTATLAATEATFVAKTLGNRLAFFQIGNEVDRFATTTRNPELTGHPWTPEAFLQEWLVFAKAILTDVPNAKFGVPDTASNVVWISAIGNLLQDDPIRSHIAIVSHHYYIGGPPSDPTMTIQRILSADPRVPKDADLVHDAAAKLHTGYRMTEGNTCYRGGKPGVSDVFAASLWSANYLLELASLGYAGVNLHGGDGQMVANSLGGTLPGEALMKDPKMPHPRPFYTPIAHIGDSYVAEPVCFGMKFAQHFAGTTMIPIAFDPGPINATAYAAHLPDGTTQIAIINKDEAQDLHLSRIVSPRRSPTSALSVDPDKNADATVMTLSDTNLLTRFEPKLRLTAPALDSRDVTLAPALARDRYTIPHGSAVLFAGILH
jgi:hypothetical protein